MTARTLPARLYSDHALYELERRKIFAPNFHLAAHASMLPRAGDVYALTIAGYQLLIVRQDNGTLRAFHNVCRHRAGPLAHDGASHCGEHLTCKYHGWRYALDGRLRSATGFGPAEGLDVRSLGLFPASVREWRGFIFVAPDEDAVGFDDFIAPLARHAARLPLEDFTFAERRTHAIACNWKTYVENYLEGYHVDAVHPSLAAEVDAARYRVTMEGMVAIHEAPARNPVANVYDGLWAWAFPVLGVNVYADGLMMERMWPDGANRTILDYLFFFREGLSDARKTEILAMSETVTGEDKVICEAVQRNLDAGIYASGVLSPTHENGVAWFQTEIRRRLGEAATLGTLT